MFGLVQGGGFRAAAHRMGVTGWARTTDDGRVEPVASADDVKLKTLENWLKRGPSAARVDAITVSDCPEQTFADLSVRG